MKTRSDLIYLFTLVVGVIIINPREKSANVHFKQKYYLYISRVGYKRQDNFQKLDEITLVLVIYFKEVNGIGQMILILFMLATSEAQKNLSTCDCSGQPLAFCHVSQHDTRFSTYSKGDHQILRRTCTYAHSRQSHIE